MASGNYFAVVNGNNAPVTQAVSGGPSVALQHINFLPTGYGIMGGGQRVVYEVTESGGAFTIGYIGQTPAGSPTNYGLSCNHIFPDSTFLIAGAQSRIYYYNGSSFTRQMDHSALISSPATKAIRDMYFLDDRIGYVVGSNGIALKCNLSSNIMDGIGATVDSIAWDSIHLSDPFGIFNTGTSSTIDIFTIDFTDRTNGFLGGMYNTVPTNAKYAMHINDQSDYFSTRFFYDRLGRMVVSQNSKQYNKSPKAFSYTEYDELGRIEEVGEKSDNTSGTLFREVFGSYVNGFYNPNVRDK